MGKIFNLDAPVIQWLGKVGQMMLTTVMWLICCLPIFTVGAATTAMYRIMFNLKEDRSCAMKEFFKSFRGSFGKATILWLILLGCVALLAAVFYLVVLLENTMLRLVALVVFSVAFFVVFIGALYIFPLTAYFENTVAGTLRNAVGMGLGNLRNSVFAGAVTMLPLVAYLLSPQIFLQMMFLWLVLGPGAIAYGVVCALSPVFHRYVPGEEKSDEVK